MRLHCPRNHRCRTSRTGRRCLTLAAISSLVYARISSANSETYVGPNGGNFSSASNWNTGITPNSGDDVTVGANDGANITLDVNFDYQSTNYSDGGFNSVTIDSPSPEQSVTVVESPTGSIVGSLSTVSLVIGNNNEGEFDQTGTSDSTNTVSGSLVLGAATGSSGQYDLDEGTLSEANLVVGRAGNGTLVQSNASTDDAGNIALGQLTGGAGFYTLQAKLSDSA